MTTKSLDNIIFEVIEENGQECVSYCRQTSSGKYMPGMEFLKGDKAAAVLVLRQIADLIGFMGKIG